MATVKAVSKYNRISPQKVREIAYLVRGKEVGSALEILAGVQRRPARYIARTIRSAEANAKDRKIEGTFYLKTLLVEEGPSMKRFRAASMGRSMGVVHRTTHINVELTNEWDKK